MVQQHKQPGMDHDGDDRRRGAPLLMMASLALLLFALLHAIGTLRGWG